MDSLAAALGRISSGIYILTCAHTGKRTGMLASWVMQASFEPPILTVAVNRQRYMAQWLAEKPLVAVNVLADEGKGLLSHFSRGFKPDEEAFTGLELLPADSPSSPPVLRDALAYLIGVPVGQLDTGDHVLFAIQLERGELLRQGAPMIHLRSNGMHY